MRIFILVALNLFFHCMQAASLDVFYTINRFYQIEEQKSYIEVSYLVPFNAVTYETNENKQLQAKLKVDFLLKNNEEVVYQKKYILQTPTYSSATEINQNLTDLVRLLAITDDTLTLAFSVTDMQDTTRTFYNQTAIFIPLVREASLSDIMLINSAESTNEKSAFERNDLLVIPKFLNYYPNDVTTLQFYCEFYQKTQAQNYLVSYLLTDEEGLYIDGYAAHKKILGKTYEAIIAGFDISKLPSGNYYLFMELKDSNNNIIERKRTFFQRSNKSEQAEANKNELKRNELEVITNNFAEKYDLKNIKHHIQALVPIATYFEAATIESFKNAEDLALLQKYFFSFWKERNQKEPELAWKAYAEKLKFVEENFTNMNERGYETDRGIVYLKYGEPFRQTLNRKKTQGEFWVWNYEKIGDEANVYFIFLNQNNLTDDYALVHTSLRGNIFDKNWAEYLKDEL